MLRVDPTSRRGGQQAAQPGNYGMLPYRYNIQPAQVAIRVLTAYHLDNTVSCVLPYTPYVWAVPLKPSTTWKLENVL